MDEAKINAEEKSAESAAASAAAHEANEKARIAQMQAIVVEALKQIVGQDGEPQGAEMRVLLRRVPILCTNIQHMHEAIDDLKDMVKDIADTHVTKEAFSPIQKLVYGLVGLILTAVVVAILALIINAK